MDALFSHNPPRRRAAPPGALFGGPRWVDPQFSPGRYDVREKTIFLNICVNFSKVPLGQTALGARSLVYSPSSRTYSLKRSHHYALGRKHALWAKILRDRHAPW